MSRPKGKRFELSNAKIISEDYNLTIIARDESDDSLEIGRYDGVEELLKFTDIDRVKIIVKEAHKRNMKQRAGQYKYGCQCGTFIKSKNENLHVHCTDCDSDFVLIEK
jgi:hypothetical protein